MFLLILKSSACLAVFMLFYKLCLERTSVHILKRFYLVAVILISVGIPFITFTEYIETTEASLIVQTFDNVAGVDDTLKLQYYLINSLWGVYIIGTLIFSYRFFNNLLNLYRKIKHNPKYKNRNYINVLLSDLVYPHTFFKYIFLDKLKYENKLIPKEVLIHEQAHAHQKHTLDIILIEFIQIIFWFNPLFYFIKKDIKLNHEFLADQAVINCGYSTKKYQHLLLAYSSPENYRDARTNQLANAINYSLIKKRFTVMKTKTSQRVIWLRSLILLPLLAILIFSFSSRAYVQNNANYDSALIQKKATSRQVEEYNALAKKYNNQPEDKRVIKLKDIKRLEYLYSLMSKSQIANAEPFPNCPPPPIAPKPVKIELVKAPHPAKEPYKLKKNQEAAPTSPKAAEPYKLREVKEVPLPPPPPKIPLDHVISMARKGATFYYNGKSVTSDKAIELIKNNGDLNISTNTNNGKSVVKIQTEPIRH